MWWAFLIMISVGGEGMLPPIMTASPSQAMCEKLRETQAERSKGDTDVQISEKCKQVKVDVPDGLVDDGSPKI